MNPRKPPSGQPKHQRRPHWRSSRGRRAGFTLVEVTIAAALAVFVIAGLAAATVSTVRTNQEVAEIGTPERALHEALERISHDLRTNDGDGEYRCGRRSSSPSADPLNVNGSIVHWRTNRVIVDTYGDAIDQSTCGSLANQMALRVTATTQDEGATHQRTTLVSLVRGEKPIILSFTADKYDVRPNEPVTLSWRIERDPPPATTMLLNGQRVENNLSSTRGSFVVRPQEEDTTYTLVADSPFGSDEAELTIDAGSAPIIRHLSSNPVRYTPGEPLRLRWEIDPRPLAFQGGKMDAPGGISDYTIPSAVNGSGIATGSRRVTAPSGASGTLDFVFSGRSAGGESKRTLRVQECPVPTVSVSSSRTRIDEVGRISRNVTISWTTEDAVSGTFTNSRGVTNEPIPSGDVASGSRSERVTVREGGRRTYTFTVNATSDCGRTGTGSVSVVLDSDEKPDPPKTETPEDDTDGDDGGATDPGEPDDDTSAGGGIGITCADLDIDTTYCACSHYTDGTPYERCVYPGDSDYEEGDRFD